MPDYRWVLTRAPGVRTQRRTVARHGPYALQERTSPFDVSLTSGVFIDRQIRDDSGEAYIQPQFGPLEFWVAALRRDRVWLQFDVEGPRAAQTPTPQGRRGRGPRPRPADALRPRARTRPAAPRRRCARGRPRGAGPRPVAVRDVERAAVG